VQNFLTSFVLPFSALTDLETKTSQNILQKSLSVAAILTRTTSKNTRSVKQTPQQQQQH